MDMPVLYTAYNTPMQFTTLFFDLDETLYPHNNGLWAEIRARINAYLHERMGFPLDQIETLRESYFRQYGTTLRGLQAHHQVDMEDYLAFVHNVPISRYLHADPQLRTAIQGMPVRKYIFTNADTNHAKRVLEAIGLDGLFDRIIDVHVIAPFCKPMPESFELALKAAGSPDPRACVLLDDQRRVTRAARHLGMYTILVGEETPGDDADAALPHLVDLPGLLDGRI
jgi:putative hydrolase of the HAD superfamily